MAHIPVNHPLRRLYKTLTALAGLYILIFGIVGLTRTSGMALFSQSNLPWVLGLRTNLAFAILSVLGGIVMLAAVVIGRNFDHYMEIAAGGAAADGRQLPGLLDGQLHRLVHPRHGRLRRRLVRQDRL
jgi:hypothetical protein